MKRILSLLLLVALLFTFVACSSNPSNDEETTGAVTEAPTTEAATTEAATTEAATTESPTTEAPTTEAPTTEAPTTEEVKPTPTEPILNGVHISEYSIVYSNTLDYNKRAATYIQEEIKERTSFEIPVVKDTSDKVTDYEIVVGETTRDISARLDEDTTGMQFAILAEEKQIALEGDYFVIAAAAYFFVETYIPADKFDSTVPDTVSIHDPIVKEAKNYIFLIGDGMGVNQTKLFDVLGPVSEYSACSDGEDLFYGYMFPAQGFAQTNSRTGVTDSAAGGTALATGYKTDNGYVGMLQSRKLKSLTELAGSLGMSTAVMSTDAQTGATPAAFSAHVRDRNYSDEIKASQAELVAAYGTTLYCGANAFMTTKIEQDVVNILDDLDDNEKGFFLMYEEGYIDKHCHSNDMNATYSAVIRFNQLIATFMEYAFYNPETFVIITADHETGGLTDDGAGGFKYTSGGHTGANVPVFAYGYKSELFNGKTINNVQIPKTIASFWGVTNFGNSSLEGHLTE